ncbi:6676615b-7302-462e-931b-d0e4b2b581d6 [Thermothielavioides terrestris]|uniref:6676615b-7302-462e-931b-d0e4b2b581d6 n=1 Tax=Thermothielavioides terrestris TaxID=2587410 RepID=A0A3S4AYY0_9PEZI|nr:6676615b-7302-462e-931b-d0e4b2b581d6 [Thermothielavioides terrestris]
MPGKEISAIAAQEAPQFEHVVWYKDPGLRRLYLVSCFGLMVASATTGYDGSWLNTVQQFDYWENYFDHVGTADNQKNMLGLLTNMFTIGSIVSMFIVPYATDRWGRKPSIIAGCLFMIVGGFINTFSKNMGMLLAGRCILGFGNSLSQLASPMLLTEIIHPQHRAPVTAVYNCLWNLGSLLCTFIGWGTSYVPSNWSWRSITLIQIAPSACQLAFIWFVPESPRWLISKDRNEEALQVLAKYHANGNTQNSTVQFEYREIRETLELEKEAREKSSYLDFIKTKGNRWRLAIIVSVGLISQYSGNAVISNYMNLIYEGAGITDQNQKLGISAGKTVLDLSCALIAAFMVDKVGRRPLFLTAISGMVIAFTLWTIMAAMYDKTNHENGFGIAQIVFVWVFGIFYDIGFSGLLVAYTLEVLPFHLRAKGVFIMNITVQATLALGGQTNQLAWDNLPAHWNFCLFYTLWDLVEWVWIYFVFVETKGPTLEEIAKIFDGEDAVAHVDLNQVEKEMEIANVEQDEKIKS